MPSARVTIVVEYPLEKENYRNDPDTGAKLTDEALDKLTGQQMLDMEKESLETGEISLAEIVENVDEDDVEVTWELVD
jgi:hypothetical protein